MFDEVALNWPTFREQVQAFDNAGMSICGKKASEVIYPRKPYSAEPALDPSQLNTTFYAQPATVGCSLGAYEIFKKAGFY